MSRVGTSAAMPPDVVEFFRSLFAGRRLTLDVGCGQAQFVDESSVGIDLDEGALDSAKRVVCGSVAATLPFRDESFDGVLAKDILEHLPDPLSFMAELRRVAAPGALLVLTTPRPVPRAVWNDYTHVRGFTRHALESLCSDSGWAIERVRRSGSIPGAGRLRLTKYVPALLAVPGFGHRFGTNWLVEARRV